MFLGMIEYSRFWSSSSSKSSIFIISSCW
jgi:hypothetical protein